MEHGFINLTPENIMGEHKGHGYGRQLMEYCLNDAKERGKSGVCMLGAEKQKAWLSDQAFAMKYGFEEVDSTKDGYKLLALSFDGTLPLFSLPKTPGLIRALMFNPALATQGELPRRGKRRPPGGCASERMKTQRFSFFAGFAARRPAAAGQFRPVSRGGTSCFLREAKPVKLEKVAERHFFDTLKPPVSRGLYAVQREISPARSASCSSHTCPWLPSRPGRRAGLRRRGRAS